MSNIKNRALIDAECILKQTNRTCGLALIYRSIRRRPIRTRNSGGVANTFA